MTIQRKAYSAKTETLADKRQIRVICSTQEVDRAGEIVVQDGIDLTAYRSNPVVLWQHDVNQPVAKAIEIAPSNGMLMALVEFPPEETSVKADEIYGLIKSGVINAVSIGFTPIETEPMDPGNPKKGPQKYVTCELAEFSFVSVPALRSALVVERQNKDVVCNWKVGASRNLPTVPGDDKFDAALAALGIFEKAEFGGDHPHTGFARKGFLVYDADDPETIESYKIPFAKMIDGRLTVTSQAIVEAKSLLEQSDIPDDVAAKARAVIDHYEGKMAPNGAIKTEKTVTSKTKDAPKLKIKGLYDVAQLCQVLANLGYIEDSAEWEAEYEGDGSQVPAMLAAAMRSVADALLAMTAEEIAELLAEETDEGADAVTKNLVAKDAKPLVKIIAGLNAKAGARISAPNQAMLDAAASHMTTAMDHMKSATAACTKAAEHVNNVMSPPEDDAGDDAAKTNSSVTDKTTDANALTQRARMVEVMLRQAAA